LAITRGKDSKAVLVLSVLIDKLSLLISILIFALLGLLTSNVLSRFIAVALPVVVLLAICSIILLVLCRYRVGGNPAFTGIIRNRLPAFVRGKFLLITENTGVPRISFSVIIAALALSLGFQLANTIGVFVLAQAMHVVITPLDWAAITAIVSIAQILPISIGGLGLREGIYAGILSLYGVTIAQATAFSLTGFVLVAFLLLCSWVILESRYVSKLLIARPE
jgi:uncharacterized membrane protein YbhN (UPF0104 family)